MSQALFVIIRFLVLGLLNRSSDSFDYGAPIIDLVNGTREERVIFNQLNKNQNASTCFKTSTYLLALANMTHWGVCKILALAP